VIYFGTHLTKYTKERKKVKYSIQQYSTAVPYGLTDKIKFVVVISYLANSSLMYGSVNVYTYLT